MLNSSSSNQNINNQLNKSGIVSHSNFKKHIDLRNISVGTSAINNVPEYKSSNNNSINQSVYDSHNVSNLLQQHEKLENNNYLNPAINNQFTNSFNNLQNSANNNNFNPAIINNIQNQSANNLNYNVNKPNSNKP